MCFERKFLSKYGQIKKPDVSVNESIEQLNLLENNILMKALEVKKDIPSLNVRDDLRKLEREFKLKYQQKF